MPTIQQIARLAFQGGTETRRQLEEIAKGGDAAKAAFERMDAAGKKVPATLRAVDSAAATVKGNLEGVASRLGVLGQAANSLGNIGTIAAAGAVGVGVLGAGLLALTKHALDAAGSLVDTADATGVGIEQLQKYHIAAATAGVSAEQFDDAIQTLNKSVGQAQAGTGRLTKLLSTVDAGLLASLKSATTSSERFDLLANKLANTESASQRVAIATAAGGAAFAKLLPLLKDGENGFETLGDAAERAGAIMSDEAARAADDAGDKFAALALILEGQVNAAFIQTAPLIENIAEAALSAAPAVLQFINSFLPAASANEALRRLEEGLTKKRNELENIQAQGFDSTALKEEIAGLEKDQAKLRDQASATAADRKRQHEQRMADIKAENDATGQAVKDRAAQQKAEREAESAARKAASEAASAEKKAAAEAQRNREETLKLESDARTAGLEGIALIQAKRDEALAENLRRYEEEGLAYEDFERRRIAITDAAERDISAVRQDEAEKRAADQQRIAEREQRIAERNAERLADELNRPLEEAFADIGRVGQDALEAFANGAHVTFQDIADDLQGTIIHAIIELAKQQFLLNIGANITGGGGGTAGVAGGGGGGFGGLLQTGQQLLSFGKTLKSGFDSLTSGLFGATEATGLLASDVAALAASGITLVPSTAALTSAEAALLFPSGVIPASFGGVGAAGVGGAGGAGGAGAAAGAAGAGASLAGAASTAGILIAVVAALEGIMGVLNVSKSRDAAFGNADTRKVFVDSFDPLTMQIANLTALISSGQNANNLFAQQQRILFGGASTGDKLQFAASLTATPLGPMLLPLLAFAAFTKPPTHGTALRKSFEEFLENGPAGEDGFGFFGRDSGTFKRGIGQTGLSANDVHGGDILARARAAIGQGARGIAADKGIDFVEAQKEFIELQRESIGLTIEEEKQVTGLGAAFRALIGPKAGEEETRIFGVIADFLGSINAEGASAAETLDIVADVVASLGRPELVFQKLNEFFTSDANDIGVKEYRDAIQGLAAALFQDLPKGVDAAALALEELNKAGDGKVTFDQIAQRVEAAAAEAEAIGSTLESAFLAGFGDQGVNVDKLSSGVFAEIGEGLKQTIAQSVFDGFIDGAFKGDVLGPFIATLKDVTDKVKNGDLSQEDANRILVDAAKEAKANLETFKPLIQQAVTTGRELASVFDDIAQNAEDAAEAFLSGGFEDLARRITGNPAAFLDDTAVGTTTAGQLASNEAIQAFHDAVLTAMHDAVLNGFVSAMIESAIEPAILAPFTAATQGIFAKLNAGEITPEEAQAQLSTAFADAKNGLSALDPVLRTFIQRVAELGDSLNDASGDAANARDAFGQAIDQQLLAALDPELAAQFNLEVTQRERLHQARELGVDLTKVERLNGLEREAVARQLVEKLTNLEEQRADLVERRTEQINRVMEQFFKSVEGDLKGLQDTVKDFTASPRSPLPPEVALRSAKLELANLFDKARAGDADALQDLPKAFEDAVGLAQQLFGSTDRFFEFFGPALAEFQSIAGLDAKSFALSDDAKAQIDEIEAASDKEIAALDKQLAAINANHDEAMALFDAMLDALLLDAEGNRQLPTAGQGTGEGDIKTVGRPSAPLGGEASSGRYGIDSRSQFTAQQVLAGLTTGGVTDQLLEQLEHIQRFQEVAALAGLDSPLGHLAKTLLTIAPGVNSLSGWQKLVGAFRDKIHDPGKFSPILGFGEGGSFIVPGQGSGDIFPLLPNVRATPGEHVTITNSGMDHELRANREVSERGFAAVVAVLNKSEARVAELTTRVAHLESMLFGEVNKPTVTRQEARLL